MTDDAYTIRKLAQTIETLLGPDDFDCDLDERNDASWSRDGHPAVQRLNEQHREIVRLRSCLTRISRAARDVLIAPIGNEEDEAMNRLRDALGKDGA